MESGKTRNAPKPCVHDLLLLAATGKSSSVTGRSLLAPVPIPQGEATQACTGCLFTNIPTSHLFLIVSISAFVGRGR